MLIFISIAFFGGENLDLFSMNKAEVLKKSAPLADRMRPKQLQDFLGQEHLLGPGKHLTRLIQTDRLGSMIIYGPPGTGKTTLAMLVANQTKREYVSISAVTSGIQDIRNVTKQAEEDLGLYGRGTLLFIDEIHRFNKTQQDALLPFVEKGILTLIGATTENPFFSVNKALLSRCQILEFKPLAPEEIKRAVQRALDEDIVLSTMKIELTQPAVDYLAVLSNGDVRTALNALEIAALSSEPKEEGTFITPEDIRESVQVKHALYDDGGDEHYNTASAFIKSIRGSDVDAVLYYLAVMIKAGEDPRFIARRLIISAAEDIGLANPQALGIAVAAHDAVQLIGMPEGRIPLAEAAVYLAMSPKSNSAYLAIDRALAYLDESGRQMVPIHLRDTAYQGAKTFGHGEGYLYPHDYPEGYVPQQYLPDEAIGQRFFTATDHGEEEEYYQEYIKRTQK